MFPERIFQCTLESRYGSLGIECFFCWFCGGRSFGLRTRRAERREGGSRGSRRHKVEYKCNHSGNPLAHRPAEFTTREYVNASAILHPSRSPRTKLSERVFESDVELQHASIGHPQAPLEAVIRQSSGGHLTPPISDMTGNKTLTASRSDEPVVYPAVASGRTYRGTLTDTKGNKVTYPTSPKEAAIRLPRRCRR